MISHEVKIADSTSLCADWMNTGVQVVINERLCTITGVHNHWFSLGLRSLASDCFQLILISVFINSIMIIIIVKHCVVHVVNQCLHIC